MKSNQPDRKVHHVADDVSVVVFQNGSRIVFRPQIDPVVSTAGTTVIFSAEAIRQSMDHYQSLIEQANAEIERLGVDPFLEVLRQRGYDVDAAMSQSDMESEPNSF